jgi:formyltetrahydrofolate deformylase
MEMFMEVFVLTLKCQSRRGIVAAVSAKLLEHGGDVTEAAQYDDPLTRLFFMRVLFTLPENGELFKAAFEVVAQEFGMIWNIHAAREPSKVLVLVSKFDHCLHDLLYRMQIGELHMQCVGVISNHPKEALSFALPNDVTYSHLPITKETKFEQEARIKEIVTETGAELIILARYMQVLSDDLSAFLSGRCINIHHSFLPGFKGAKPYHQAYERGVKMIGATAHYVTSDLDEGPIIVQDVAHVTHADTPQDMIRKGRDIERRVLAQAVKLHIEGRVMSNDFKTVVFS